MTAPPSKYMDTKTAEVKRKLDKGWVHPTVKRVIDGNKKIKEQRKKDSLRNMDALIDEVADHHFKYVKGGAVIKMGGYGPGVKRYCFICGKHDYEMVSGIGQTDGSYYCTKHKSVRGFPLTEQEQIRSKHHVKE
jgi:hypothetical protein